MDVLKRPLSKREITRQSNENEHGYVKGCVYAGMSEFVNNDLEGVLDMLSEKLVGSALLMDINYTVKQALSDNMLVVEVTGDPSMVNGGGN